MKYQGKITDPKDLVTKEYVDTGLSGKLGTSGDGSNVTAAFDAASSRTNISTGEKLTVIFGKIAKWFADLGAAAFRGVDSVPTDNSTNLVESGGIKSAINSVQDDIAIRVSGNKTSCASGAAIGQYVIVDGSTITGITDGLYKAAKAIPYDTAIDNTYLTAVSGGAANDLKLRIAANADMITFQCLGPGGYNDNAPLDTSAKIEDFIIKTYNRRGLFRFFYADYSKASILASTINQTSGLCIYSNNDTWLNHTVVFVFSADNPAIYWARLTITSNGYAINEVHKVALTAQS